MSTNVSLGPLESRLLFTLEAQGRRFFNFNQAQEILEVSASSAQNVLHRLRRKRRITELEKGKYALNPARSGLGGHWVEDAFLAADFLLDAYYIGFWSALRHWDLTEQIPQLVQVATPQRKAPVHYGGQELGFITIAEARFFGHTRAEKAEGGSFRIATPEKAILDALTYPQHCGGLTEASRALWQARPSLDTDRLRGYVDRLGVSAVRRRLGYLLALHDLLPALQADLQQAFKGYRWLDPTAPKEIRAYDHDWGLQLNLSDAALRGDGSADAARSPAPAGRTGQRALGDDREGLHDPSAPVRSR